MAYKIFPVIAKSKLDNIKEELRAHIMTEIKKQSGNSKGCIH